jgi:Polyketide cyclase / dehydrase and lipid transport
MSEVEWSGRFELSAPPGRAFAAFTPRGERGWVPGWEPVFAGAADDDTAPGTVFETQHGGRRTTWLVVDRELPAHVRYARVTPGISAGTVTVDLAPAGDGTAVEVTYRMRALSAAGAAQLEQARTDPGTSPSGWRAPVEAFLRGTG